jgi:ribonuclease HII
MLVGGVDDAGRGAVVGPLVIAGVLIDEYDIAKLVNIGVKDSKLVAPRKREILCRKIREISYAHCSVKLEPNEIDDVVNRGIRYHKLNRLEAQAMAKVILTLSPDTAYVDASDVSEARYGEYISDLLPSNIDVISKHKADKIFPVVSAASIVAKVERDRYIREMKRRYGEIGSGYVSDHLTIAFLEHCIKTNGSYPNIVRKSWSPAQRIRQRILSE